MSAVLLTVKFSKCIVSDIEERKSMQKTIDPVART